MKQIPIRQIISKLFILIAICLLCYPAIGDTYNTYRYTKVIEEYQQDSNIMNDETYTNLIKEAQNYNEELASKTPDYKLSKEENKKYMSLLNIKKDGVMGVVTIPKIKVNLPIYHTTSDKVLKKGAGHIPGTSLPIGGESTHSVILGHSGMVYAPLFTNLSKLKKGDKFQIIVLKQILSYQIDKIETVLPNESDKLKIVEGKDYCTLVTCTPVGKNTHRLLVRGHRVDNSEEVTEIKCNNVIREVFSGNVLTSYEVWMIYLAIILLIIGFIYPFIRYIFKKIKNKK